MFEVGDYVVYGNTGVCKVTKVGSITGMHMPKDKMFYTLVPVYSKGSKVFTPIDSEKVIMRPVMSAIEAEELINGMKDTDELEMDDNKKRDDIIKEAMRTCDCRELLKVIKTLHARKKLRLEDGKKVTAGDEKFLHIAEENLHRELAIALGIEKTEVEEYIQKKMEE